MVSHITNHVMKGITSSAYDNRMAAARQAVRIKTDEQIRNWLKENGEQTGPVAPEDVEKFRASGQQEMQDLLDGKPTKAEYEKKLVAKLTSVEVKLRIFKDTMRLSTIVWLVFGVLSAWRIAGD